MIHGSSDEHEGAAGGNAADSTVIGGASGQYGDFSNWVTTDDHSG